MDQWLFSAPSRGQPLFQVWYADNEHEVLGIDFVLKLASSASWRQQALAVQAHVVPARLETGVYHSNEEVRMISWNVLHPTFESPSRRHRMGFTGTKNVFIRTARYLILSAKQHGFEAVHLVWIK